MNWFFTKPYLDFLILLSLVTLLETSVGCSGKTAVPAVAELMCIEHGVPERFCIPCHPELKSQLLMCREHGVPEEICTICHPDAVQKYNLTMICKEHGLPEHLCPKCNSAIKAGELKSDWCPEHGVPKSLCIRCDPELAKTLPMCVEHGLPEAICTICRPELAKNFITCKLHNLPLALCGNSICQSETLPVNNGATKTSHDSTECEDDNCTICREKQAVSLSLPLVRLAGPDVASKAGIATVPAVHGSLAPTVAANGEVAYDETHLAHVRPRVAGIIREVLVKPGDTVSEGQVLAVIDSAELGQAKAEYLAARPLVELWRKTLSRDQGLGQQGIIAGKQVFEAQAELQRAEAELMKATQRLRNFGFDSWQLAGLEQEDEGRRNEMKIAAPLDGTVVRRRAVVGEAVEATAELFTVADVSRVWVNLEIFEKDLRRIHVGQPVTFRVQGLEPSEFPGKVAWIDTEVNDRTRTIRVRVEAENQQGLMRANMFGRGEIQVGDQHTSLVVPNEAVQWEGSSYVVFVQTQTDQFEPRRVLTGQNLGKQIELAWADLKPGELIVTTGSFLLKTEIQKGSIGAGCCGD
ncbi:MAG TPA: efflux RND transporter periplasmic adaptor subunit [Thermoguttaceae bacterium]